jgi:hypothetical protein
MASFSSARMRAACFRISADGLPEADLVAADLGVLDVDLTLRVLQLVDEHRDVLGADLHLEETLADGPRMPRAA